MLRTLSFRMLLALLLAHAAFSAAQSAGTVSAVPRLVNFSGKVLDAQGKPLPGVATVTFSIYKDQEGGEPLWRETQNLEAGADGAYTVQLGAMETAGLPLELFATGESRWLGVRVNGGEERPRVLMLSVPYALKAADAETLGGLPPSAFVLAKGVSDRTANYARASPQVTTNPALTGKGTAGYLPLWDTTSDLVNSSIFQRGVNIGIGTTAPALPLDVNVKMGVRDTLTLYPKGTDPLLNMPATGFQIGSTGLINFASGQTFPGVGTIKGIITGPTSGLAGGGTSGTPNLIIAPKGIANSMLAHPMVTLPVTAPLTGGGAVALGATATPLALKPCASGQVLVSNGTSWSCTGAAGTGKVASVALSAPASDFVVKGSPITTTGTLSLAWNTPPSSGNTANSIVKRDATGSFTAGAIVASLGMEGITATDSGNGVAGLNTGGGTAIYGAASNGVGVWGQSSGTGAVSDGVHGVTGSGSGSGVAGVNNGGGVGVYGVGGTGVFGTGTVGFGTDSNVQQAVNAGGWVKAMAYVNADSPPYKIVRCFNSTLTGADATTAPCGLILTEYVFGIFNLKFNFPINNRFWSTTLAGGNARCANTYVEDSQTLGTTTGDCGSGLESSDYMVIVY